MEWQIILPVIQMLLIETARNRHGPHKLYRANRIVNIFYEINYTKTECHRNSNFTYTVFNQALSFIFWAHIVSAVRRAVYHLCVYFVFVFFFTFASSAHYICKSRHRSKWRASALGPTIPFIAPNFIYIRLTLNNDYVVKKKVQQILDQPLATAKFDVKSIGSPAQTG